MLLRIFFFFKAKFNHSSIANPFNKKLCKEHGFYPTTWFIFKIKMKEKPLQSFFWLFVTSVICLSIMFLIFEIEIFLDSASIRSESIYLNVLYLVIITISSLGYGDIYPHTIPGKLVVMFMALWGAVLISFTVNMVSFAFSINDK